MQSKMCVILSGDGLEKPLKWFRWQDGKYPFLLLDLNICLVVGLLFP